MPHGPFTNLQTAVGTAAISQFRILGGLVGIAFATSLSTPYLRSHIPQVAPASSVALILEKTANIHLLPADLRTKVEKVFAESFSVQIKLVIGFAAAQIPATLLMWTKQHVAEPSK